MQQDTGHRWRVAHHLVGGMIVAAFALSVGVQACDGARQSVDLGHANALQPVLGEQTFGIYYQGKKIGFSESLRRRDPGGGVRYEDRAYWRFRAQGRVQRLAIESSAVVSASWQLQSFSARVDAGLARISVRGQVQADAIEVDLTTGGKTQHSRYAIDGPVLMPGLVRAYVAALQPSAGEALAIEVYNPLIRSVDTIEVIVDEVLDQGYRLTEILRGELSSHVRIDRAGQTLEETSALGFRVVAEPRAQALAFDDDSDEVPDLIFAAAVPARGLVPDDPRAARQLSARISGVKLSSFKDARGGGQEVEGDILRVQVAPWPKQVSFRVREPGAERGPLFAAPELQGALAATPLVQSDDEAIREAAWRVLGEQRDPARAVRLLTQWVNSSLRKVNSVGVPSALEVLRSRQGDCNEHTVLLTALLRAIGVPARMAAGVVLADLNGDGPSFYYHAWTEVWLDRWIPVDATFGQAPADATHLRFVLGGLERQVDILKLIGALRIELFHPGSSDLSQGASAEGRDDERAPEESP